MITLEDCLDYCELNEKEVDAIAEHDHEPTIVSVGHCECLLASEKGKEIIKKYLLDDISYANKIGNSYHAQILTVVYENFDRTHK